MYNDNLVGNIKYYNNFNVKIIILNVILDDYFIVKQ